MRNPFFTSFLKSLGATLGVLIAMLLLVISISLVNNKSVPVKETRFDEAIIPGPTGKRANWDSSHPTIVQINIHGMIGTPLLNTQVVADQLQQTREGTFEDRPIKGLFLHIDSGGGAANDSDTIYRLIKAYREAYKVPVWAFVDGVCASGSFYIACAAERVLASPSSLIGSIGVRLGLPFFNVSDVLKKWEVDTFAPSAGKGKDALNPFLPWKEGEGENIKQIIEALYQQFLTVVTENRPNLNRTSLVEEYGAKVFETQEALERGFIDQQVSTRQEALMAFAQSLKLEPDKVQVVLIENKLSFMQRLIDSQSKALKGEFLYLWSQTPLEF